MANRNVPYGRVYRRRRQPPAPVAVVPPVLPEPPPMCCNICANTLLQAVNIHELNPQPYRRSRNHNAPDDSHELRCAPCGHVFHKLCLISYFRKYSPRWIRRPMNLTGNCPRCTLYFTMRSVYPVFLEMEMEGSEARENVEPDVAAPSAPRQQEDSFNHDLALALGRQLLQQQQQQGLLPPGNLLLGAAADDDEMEDSNDEVDRIRIVDVVGAVGVVNNPQEENLGEGDEPNQEVIRGGQDPVADNADEQMGEA